MSFDRWSAPPGHDSKMRQTSLSLCLRVPSVSHLMRTHGVGCLDAGDTWTWLSARTGTGKDAETSFLVSGKFHTPHVRGYAFQVDVFWGCFLG